LLGIIGVHFSGGRERVRYAAVLRQPLGRSDQGFSRPSRAITEVGPLPKMNPTEYLRNGQLYFDTIMFSGEAMRHLIAEVGIEHVVMGTDYPFPWNTAPVDHILSISRLSDADKIAMLGGTAAKLLGIDS
jgi:predicted TIM-barrel fold metal-dependent hydrolase